MGKPGIDLNADLGEGGARDAELLALASSANIACGGHAGDEGSMRAAIAAALARGTALGAHPGYEDRAHFGRRPLRLPPAEVADLVSRQVERLATLASAAGGSLHHVKPHGALYHQAGQDPDLAAAVAAGVRRVAPGVQFYVPPAGLLAIAGGDAGLIIRAEGFADRRYQAGGGLVPRSEPGAVMENAAEAAAQAWEIARHGRVRHRDGGWLSLPAETLCVHGDGESAVGILAQVRRVLEAGGFEIRA